MSLFRVSCRFIRHRWHEIQSAVTDPTRKPRNTRARVNEHTTRIDRYFVACRCTMHSGYAGCTDTRYVIRNTRGHSYTVRGGENIIEESLSVQTRRRSRQDRQEASRISCVSRRRSAGIILCGRRRKKELRIIEDSVVLSGAKKQNKKK